MVRKCCAPGCNGNYNDQNKVSVFTFPLKDQERLRFWLKKIPRDIVPTKQTVLCERHFCDEFIESYHGRYGITLARTKPRLIGGN